MAIERITMVMEPVLPGSSAVVMVGGGSDDTRLYGRRLATDGQVGEVVELPILQRTDECFTVDIPVGPYAAWLLTTSPEPKAPGWRANLPRLDWTDRSAVTPGTDLRVYGRNLVPADRYPTTDPRTPVSFGGWQEGATRLCAIGADGAQWQLELIRVNAYEAHFRLPAGLPVGVCKLIAHNGLGGELGWSEPLAVEITAALEPATMVIRIEDRLEPQSDLAEVIDTALAELADAGGGVLEFGPFSYPLTQTIFLPPNTTLRGAGKNRTLLKLPTVPAPGTTTPVGPWVAVTGDGPFALEDLCLRGVYAPVLVCAPTFLPATQDEAALLEEAIGLQPARARDIAIRRCRIEQHPLRQTMRRRDFDPRGRFRAYSERGWGGGLDDKQAAVYAKVDGLVVEDSTVLGGGEGIFLNRSTEIRISRNTLKAGHFGAAIHAHSRLTWPATGGGAPIEGNYSHEFVIEDNDISARSEFARNLVVFSFGGENLHMARNQIRGIEPTCDSEALMTHLWQARWPTPTIEMLDPTHARIIDPQGEVADEWLTDAWIDVVAGRGLGQLRKIIRRDGDLIELDRPWHCEPDDSSTLVFTAPAPFRNVTVLDNLIQSDAVNLILWGMAWDNIVDGNRTIGGPGITIWSVRLAPDQKVWGGCTYVQVINNVTEQGWAPTRDEKNAVGSAVGIFTIATFDSSEDRLGPDYLGLIVRNNHTTDDAGIGMRSTSPRGAAMRTLGVVVEGNHASASAVGIAVESGMRAIVRDNTAEPDVTMPVVLDAGPA